MGFEKVYDYVPGKVDWFANGLARHGESQDIPYAGDLAHAGVTCGPEEKLAEVRDRVREAGKDYCLVLDHNDVVLGRLRGDALSKDGDLTAAESMESAPQTFRANQPLSDFSEKRSSKDVKTVIVTTPHGRLLGVVERDELEEAVGTPGRSS
jgi:Mg/Co/Ni transporter MgtE